MERESGAYLNVLTPSLNCAIGVKQIFEPTYQLQ